MNLKARYHKISLFVLLVYTLSLFSVPQAMAVSPTLNIISPTNDSVVYNSNITISGYVNNVAPSGLMVEGEIIPVDSGGNFSTTLKLTSGYNTITVTAKSDTGHTTTKTVSVHYLSTAPQIIIESPANNKVCSTNTETIKGKITEPGAGADFFINGSLVTYNPLTGDYSKNVTLNQGLNTFHLKTELNGNITSEAYLYLTYKQDDLLENFKANNIPVTDFMVLNTANVAFAGDILLGSTAELNGRSIGDGSFAENFTLTTGENIFTINVTGSTGEKLERKFHILYDDGKPFIYNLAPENVVTTVYKSYVTVTGKVHGATSLKVNGSSISINSNGSFSKYLNLSPGENTFNFIASDGTNSTPLAYKINYEGNPGVTITSPLDGSVTDENKIIIEGEVNPNTTALKVKNETGLTPVEENITINSDKTFSKEISLKPGENKLVFTAYAGNNTVTKTFNITYGGTPSINITSPTPTVGKTVYSSPTVIGGKVYNVIDKGLKLTVNDGSTIKDRVVNVDSNGNFSVSVNLKSGENNIKLTATDGNTQIEKVLNIKYDNKPVINVTEPASNISTPSTTVTVSGKAINADKWGFTINGKTVPLNSDGTFSSSVKLTKKSNKIILKASKDGNITTKTLDVNYTGGPLLEVTSPLDGTTVNTNTVKFKGFVYPMDGLTSFTIDSEDATHNVVYDTNAGDFSQIIRLAEGENTIKFNVNDGTETLEQEITITYDNSPGIYTYSVFDGMTVFSNKLRVRGRVERTSADGLKINGEEVSFDSSGYFSKTLTLDVGSNELTISADNDDKNKSESYTVFYNDIAKQGAEAEYTINKGENVTAFNEDLNIEMAENDYDENIVNIYVDDPDDLDEPPVSSTFVGPVFDIDFDDKPLKPFELTLGYDEALNNAAAKQLSVFYYDEHDDEWIVLGGKVNTDDKTIKIKADKEGKYAAMVYYKTFDDTMSHWARRDIEYLTAQGVVNGVSDHRFNPDGTITRAEFITMLVKACGLKPYDKQNESFYDVDDDHWAYPYIEAAVRAGLASGVNSTSFAPTKQITREQAAVMLARAANLELVDEDLVAEVLDGFSDGKDVSWYAKNSVASVVDNGMMRGMGSFQFAPQGTTTRAQASVMIVRLMENLTENQN